MKIIHNLNEKNTGKKFVCFELFNIRYSKYGGHWQFLGKMTRYRIESLDLSFHWLPDIIGYRGFYYDGHHHGVHLLFIHLGWSGFPYLKEDIV